MTNLYIAEEVGKYWKLPNNPTAEMVPEYRRRFKISLSKMHYELLDEPRVMFSNRREDCPDRDCPDCAPTIGFRARVRLLIGTA